MVNHLRHLRRALVTLCLVLSVAAIATVAMAAEVRVLSGGAVKAALTELAETWGRETGNRVTITYATTGASLQKLAAGEPADVVVLTAEAIDQLAARGTVLTGTKADVARVGIGVAVRAGASAPDISTPEAVKQTVLAAKSIAYMIPAKAEQAAFISPRCWKRWASPPLVAPKAVLVDTGFAAERVATGEAEIVVHQISEILPVKGVTLVGPLPRQIQKVTVYAAAVTTKSEVRDAATALIAYLTAPAARPKFRRRRARLPRIGLALGSRSAWPPADGRSLTAFSMARGSVVLTERQCA